MFKLKSTAALLLAALPPALAQDELPESSPSGAPTQPSVTDREALEALYAVTGGDNWTVNTNWLSDKPLDQWHGVTTDNDGRVTKLMLSANELAGPVPVELGALTNLKVLWLDNNQLTG